MPIALILGKLWENKRIIAKFIIVIIIALFVYRYVVVIPAQLKKEREITKQQSKELERLGELNKLYTNIEQGKVTINANVQAQISSLRGSAMPRNTIIIRGGRVLPSLPNVNASK